MEIMEMCALLEIPVEVQELISNCGINWNDFNLKKEIAQMKDPKCWEGVVERLNTLLAPSLKEVLPEETTLQRRLKPHLLNGGKIEWATGKLRYSY